MVIASKFLNVNKCCQNVEMDVLWQYGLACFQQNNFWWPFDGGTHMEAYGGFYFCVRQFRKSVMVKIASIHLKKIREMV